MGVEEGFMRRFPRLGAWLYGLLAPLILGSMYRQVAREIASAVGDGEVLDVGTGPGHLPLELARLAPALGVTGIDLSPAMIDLARKRAERLRLDSRVVFLTGDVASLPLPDAAFDLVVSTLSLHHWRNQAKGLAELHRVMRPGGVVWIYDIHRAGTRQAMEKLVGLSPFREHHMSRVSYSRWMHPSALLKVEMR